MLGSVIETSDSATGEAPHIGQYTMVAGEQVDLATGAITGGFFTITAANGDTLTGTSSGEALPGLTGYVVSGPITAPAVSPAPRGSWSGTGRSIRLR